MINNNIETSTWLTDSFSEEEIRELRLLADISAVIQIRRKALGMSQSDHAKRLKVSQGMVSR